ncbi:unnamed protein product [Peronospora belbahrii]|uniref:Uncharacterized protein n=1 Tax=Peronospora belbahrii TaxID=622444 RepID=A0ABN8CWG9_9STRA|nr:unnamed protein product [Peronospora belbahrii]
MVKWISEFFEPITEKDLAINQLNELYSRQQKWLKLKKHPDDVFSEVGLAEPLWTMFELKTMGYKLRKWRRNTNDFIEKYPKMPATVRAYFPYEDKQLLKMLFYESSERLYSNVLITQVLEEVTEALHKTNPDLFELYELFCLDTGEIEVFSSRRMMNWLQFAKDCKPPVSPIPVLLKKNGFGEKDYDKLKNLVSEAPGSKATDEIQRLLQIESEKAKKK